MSRIPFLHPRSPFLKVQSSVELGIKSIFFCAVYNNGFVMASLRRKCIKSEVNKNVNFCTMPKNGPATSYAWLSDSNISTKIQIQFFCMIKRSFSIPFKRKLAKHAPYHIVHFSVLRHSRLKHWVKHLPLYNIRNCFVEARCTKSAADTLNTSLCFKEANVSLGAWAYNVWELPEPPSTELHRMSQKTIDMHHIGNLLNLHNIL